MVLFVCLDDDNGMMFNNRRQSKDCIVRQRMLELVGDGKIWMSEYSQMQFEEGIDVCRNKEEAGYIFAENPDDIIGLEFDKIIAYRWNRSYPSDKTLSIEGKTLVSTYEFPGNSHEKITEEIYQ